MCHIVIAIPDAHETPLPELSEVCFSVVLLTFRSPAARLTGELVFGHLLGLREQLVVCLYIFGAGFAFCFCEHTCVAEGDFAGFYCFAYSW